MSWRRDVAVGLVPVRIDAERLDVDALLVHRADAVRRPSTIRSVCRRDLQAHQGHRLGDGAVRVHVDGLHAPAVHHHLAAARRRLRVDVRAAHEIAADEREAGHRAGDFLDEFSASGHAVLSTVLGLPTTIAPRRVRRTRRGREATNRSRRASTDRF